ncbi:MAG: carboxypeptidase-like regulatory domain-containing protein [Cytophagales bacterium]|nr:carboxypeptidase-like regulatory domain-containing protein [Cytophagales bacterium]
MRWVVKILLILATVDACLAQETPAVTDSISLFEAIKEVEKSKSHLNFFYRDEWIRNVKIIRQKVNTQLNDEAAIDLLLQDTRLNFYLNNEDVILLSNTTIVVPEIQDNEVQRESQSSEILESFIFQVNTDDSDVENKMHVIGDIKKFERGKASSVRGQVTTENGPMEGIYIFSSKPFVSTITDEEGRFSITLPNGINELNFQSITTIDTRRKLNLFSNGSLDVKLKIDVVALEEVVVSAERDQNIEAIQVGLTKIEPKQISILPTFLGEKDIIRVATSTAGVQNVGEGSAGINIRGGKADQNLFLIDNNTVFTTNHFFGFFSAFNSRGVGGLSLYKNGIPAEYGGRLSSVFDIKTKRPNDKEFELSGGIGLVTSQLQLEGPINKAKTSIFVNGRGTYSQYILDQFKNSTLGNNEASFYDFTVKTHTQLSKKDELAVTGYYSYDAFKIQSDTLLSFSDFSYENKVLGASWKHVFNDQLFGILEVGNSNFGYRSSFDVLPTQAFNVDLSVNEFRTAAKFDYLVNSKLNFKFGAETKSYTLSPGEKAPKGSASLIEEEQIDEEKALEVAPYLTASYNLSEKLAIDGGIRYSVFTSYGPTTINIYEEGQPRQSSTVIDRKTYEQGDIIHLNQGPEFRLQGRYILDPSSSLKFGYGRTRQNLHLLLNAASIAPTDVWRLSGPFIAPQLADQFSVGYFRNIFDKDLIEVSVEAYYKNIENLLDFKTGAELQFNPTLETDLLQGDGKSYGVEFSVSKAKGWWSGWLNYTFSRSFIRLDGTDPSEIINGGSFFPTGYDKPHYLNSVTNYKFSSRFTMTLNVVYASGIPITYPVGKWDFKSSENILYSERNEFRIPDYFRVDLGININASHKLKQFTHSSWSFSVYNLLGRDNIYSIFFEVDEDEIKGYELSIFPTPIPTVTYNFKF